MAENYGVSIPQLAIRYVLQLGLLPLPKTVNPEHKRSNAVVDSELSEPDMATLNTVKKIENYGEASMVPVFGGRDRG